MYVYTFPTIVQDLGFMNQRGKKVETQRHDITEDQKPKELDVSMASQIQLFEAIAKLPECHSFPNWSSLKSFYDDQKRHVQGVPTESGNAIYNLKLSVPVDSSASKPLETVSQATTVVLPASWQKLFPVSVETPLALVPCPKCHGNIQISMSYVRKLENQLNQFLPLPVPEERNVEPRSGASSDDVTGNAPILAEIVRQMKVSWGNFLRRQIFWKYDLLPSKCIGLGGKERPPNYPEYRNYSWSIERKGWPKLIVSMWEGDRQSHSKFLYL